MPIVLCFQLERLNQWTREVKRISLLSVRREKVKLVEMTSSYVRFKINLLLLMSFFDSTDDAVKAEGEKKRNKSKKKLRKNEDENKDLVQQFVPSPLEDDDGVDNLNGKFCFCMRFIF